MFTHKLCFGSKIRKIGIPLEFCYINMIKVGLEMVSLSVTFFPDEATCQAFTL